MPCERDVGQVLRVAGGEEEEAGEAGGQAVAVAAVAELVGAVGLLAPRDELGGLLDDPL